MFSSTDSHDHWLGRPCSNEIPCPCAAQAVKDTLGTGRIAGPCILLRRIMSRDAVGYNLPAVVLPIVQARAIEKGHEMLQTSRRRLPQFLACGLLAVSSAVFPGCSSEPLAQPEAAKPNILFILVDDLGWADVGCFGSKLHETPNIDRLASQGMKFTNAYAACPVCSPTRASIMTGRYPVRQGITN